MIEIIHTHSMAHWIAAPQDGFDSSGRELYLIIPAARPDGCRGVNGNDPVRDGFRTNVWVLSRYRIPHGRIRATTAASMNLAYFLFAFRGHGRASAAQVTDPWALIFSDSLDLTH